MRLADGHEVPFTHPDKLLYPADGITKARLADYYLVAWPRMKRFLEGRPVTIRRFPRGLGAGGFYQRRVQDWFPDWVHVAELPMKEDPGRTVSEVVVDSPATLVFLVNIGALEIHAALAQAEAPDTPDMIIFDLDPPRDYTDAVRSAALDFRDMLKELGLPAFVKSTGSRGFHVTIPIQPRHSFDVIRPLARALAQRMIAKNPERLTLNPRKEQREGRILIDIWRNAYAQTAVAPWSTRARQHAPVAVPLFWEDLEKGHIHPRQFTLAGIKERLEGPDPWEGLFAATIDLDSWAKTAPADLSELMSENTKSG